MTYTQSLLSSGVAIGFHAKAAPPTVTMPRLKVVVLSILLYLQRIIFYFNLSPEALFGQSPSPHTLLQAMVSGAIPGYLDVVYNFNTQALQDDDIIG